MRCPKLGRGADRPAGNPWRAHRRPADLRAACRGWAGARADERQAYRRQCEGTHRRLHAPLGALEPCARRRRHHPPRLESSSVRSLAGAEAFASSGCRLGFSARTSDRCGIKPAKLFQAGSPPRDNGRRRAEHRAGGPGRHRVQKPLASRVAAAGAGVEQELLRSAGYGVTSPAVEALLQSRSMQPAVLRRALKSLGSKRPKMMMTPAAVPTATFLRSIWSSGHGYVVVLADRVQRPSIPDKFESYALRSTCDRARDADDAAASPPKLRRPDACAPDV